MGMSPFPKDQRRIFFNTSKPPQCRCFPQRFSKFWQGLNQAFFDTLRIVFLYLAKKQIHNIWRKFLVRIRNFPNDFTLE